MSVQSLGPWEGGQGPGQGVDPHILGSWPVPHGCCAHQCCGCIRDALMGSRLPPRS